MIRRRARLVCGRARLRATNAHAQSNDPGVTMNKTNTCEQDKCDDSTKAIANCVGNAIDMMMMLMITNADDGGG